MSSFSTNRKRPLVNHVLTMMENTLTILTNEIPLFSTNEIFLFSTNKISLFSTNRKGSLVDHMLTMMEKYTNNLEDLVADRTRQLEEEKIKTEKLLYKMLPV